MADETLIIEIKADTTGLEPTINLLEKLGKVDAKTAEEFRKATALFQGQQKALQGVGTQAKKAGEETEKAGKKIAASTKEAGKGFGDFINTIKGAGAAIGIGLGTAAIVAFGKESFKAFTDAEKTAKILQTAVGVNGGLQRDYEALLAQSKELQKTTIFSDDNIQKVQTIALQFGLTTKQVKELLPVIADFASATGQTLEGALEAVLRGTEGMARGLKIYGVQVLDTGTKQEKLANITQQLTDKFSGQAEIVGKTTAGQVEILKNRFNDLQEEIGEFIAGAGESTAAIINWIANGFQPLQDEIDDTGLKLDALGKQIASAIPRAVIESQIAQFKALGQAVPQKLIDDLKKLNLNEFNSQIQNLDSKQLILKVKEIQNSIGTTFADLNAETEKQAAEQKKIAQETIKDQEALARRIAEIDAQVVVEKRKNAEKILEANKTATTFNIATPGDLGLQERLDILNQEIEARKAAGRLIEGLNQEDDDAEKKRLQNLKEQSKAQEELRKFTLKSLLDNIDEQQVALELFASQTITDTERLQGRLAIIEFEALQKRIAIKKEFGESTIEEDKKVADILVKNTIAFNKEIEDSNNEAHKRRLQGARDIQDSIDAVIKSESDLSKKSLQELFLIVKIGREAGIKGLDDVKAAQDEIRDRFEKIIEGLVSIAGEASQIFNNIAQERINELEEFKERQQETFDEESEALQEKLDRDLITQAQYENQLSALKKKREADEKKINLEIKKIKQEQAERDKAFNIFETIINTARAVAQALPNIPLSLLVGALGALQLANIISTPIPKFAKGVEVLQGKGTETSDSIPAMLSKGEGVMPADINKEYRAALSAIYNRKIPASMINDFVRLKMDGMPTASKETPVQFPEMLNEYGVKRALKKGTRITNAEEIAMHIVNALPKDNPRRTI